MSAALSPAEPMDANQWNDRANQLKAQGQLTEAEAAYRSALAIAPAHPQALNNLGNLLRGNGQLMAAEDCFRQALAVWPTHPDIRNNLAVNRHEQGDFDEALALLQGILHDHPEHIEAHNNLGNLLKDQRRPYEAIQAYRRVLSLAPGHPEARWNLGLLYLLRGDYRNGWPLYEARFDPRRQHREVTPPLVNTPHWKGDALKEKHLLIWHEQGMGDEIQFARFLPALRQRFQPARLTVCCKPPLLRLFQGLAGADQVQSIAHPLPAHDVWALPGSLPGHLGITLDRLPAHQPYLAFNPNWLRDTQSAFATTDRLRVGLVWSGSRWHKNDARRSLPDLRLLAPLWQVPGIDFYSLIKAAPDDPAYQVALSPPPDQPMRALGPLIRDFADTAGMIAQLDLLISVDTAIAHLAGAMGRPVWVLLPWQGLDWRWLEQGEGSPWYPRQMRLFRQTHAAAWGPLIHSVQHALRNWQAQQSRLRHQLTRLAPNDQDWLNATVDQLSPAI